MPKSELNELWRRYKVADDEAARERLVVAYAPLVKYVAGRLSSRLPAHVEEHLIFYGLKGLLFAIDRFDIAREISFDTYAITRIRGGIIEELRTPDDSGDSQQSLLDTLPDSGAPNPQTLVDEGEMRTRIAEAITALPERDRLVIARYYYGNLTCRETGGLMPPPSDDEPPGSDDDGASGVREPRRSKPSGGADGIALPPT